MGDGEGLQSSRLENINADTLANAYLTMDTHNTALPDLNLQYSHHDTSISDEDDWSEMIANIRKRNKPPKLPLGGKSTRSNLTVAFSGCDHTLTVRDGMPSGTHRAVRTDNKKNKFATLSE